MYIIISKRILCIIYGGIFYCRSFFIRFGYNYIIILYGNETVPWFDALIRMERKTNRHRNRACLASIFVELTTNLPIYIVGRKVSGVKGG